MAREAGQPTPCFVSVPFISCALVALSCCCRTLILSAPAVAKEEQQDSVFHQMQVIGATALISEWCCAVMVLLTTLCSDALQSVCDR